VVADVICSERSQIGWPAWPGELATDGGVFPVGVTVVGVTVVGATVLPGLLAPLATAPGPALSHPVIRAAARARAHHGAHHTAIVRRVITTAPVLSL
jgi:hypothetical protein